MALKVNFSQSEADSKPREVPPSGEYACKLTNVELKEVKPGSVNVGKPYWNIEFVIQDGTYAGGHLFSNVMLFATDKEGTLSSLSQLLKAIGFEVTAGEFELPEAEDLMGRDINIRGRKLAAGYDKRAQKELPDRFQITGYKPVSKVAKTGNSQYLP